MVIKCLFQDCWQLDLGWDEEVPDEVRLKFIRWLNGTEILKNWEIPRSYFSGKWHDIKQCVELHVFSDASERGYGTVVYLRYKENGDYVTSLVISKNKVAPIKKQTLPRLELLGCLLAARLVMFVREALELPPDTPYTCWTDSMICVGWIKSKADKFKQFVLNRVREIQNLTDSSRWFHCKGTDNPADLTTRGIYAESLIHNELWLLGPKMLCDKISTSTKSIPEAISEIKTVTIVSAETPKTNLFDFQRWGTFLKAIRVIAWVLRFINNSQKSNTALNGELSYNELTKAKTELFKEVQNQAFSS